MSTSIKTRLFKMHLANGLFWFRLFGLGLVIKNTTKHPLMFSERQKITKSIRLGKYSIKFLNR